MENHHPNPPNGCMGKDPIRILTPTHNKAISGHDCLHPARPPAGPREKWPRPLPPATVLKMNVPGATVAHFSLGGEYFKLTDAKTLERNLATISNHIPNRYILSFQPQSPHPGPSTSSACLCPTTRNSQ